MLTHYLFIRNYIQPIDDLFMETWIVHVGGTVHKTVSTLPTEKKAKL